MVVVLGVAEEPAVVDGVTPTISTSRDFSAVAGAFELGVTDTELDRLKDDVDRDTAAGMEGVAMVVLDWESVEEAETDTAALAGETV